MTMHLYVITTTAAPDGGRVCIVQQEDLYRIGLLTPTGTLQSLNWPPTTDLEEAYGHLIQTVLHRRMPTPPPKETP